VIDGGFKEGGQEGRWRGNLAAADDYYEDDDDDDDDDGDDPGAQYSFGYILLELCYVRSQATKSSRRVFLCSAQIVSIKKTRISYQNALRHNICKQRSSTDIRRDVTTNRFPHEMSNSSIRDQPVWNVHLYFC